MAMDIMATTPAPIFEERWGPFDAKQQLEEQKATEQTKKMANVLFKHINKKEKKSKKSKKQENTSGSKAFSSFSKFTATPSPSSLLEWVDGWDV